MESFSLSKIIFITVVYQNFFNSEYEKPGSRATILFHRRILLSWNRMAGNSEYEILFSFNIFFISHLNNEHVHFKSQSMSSDFEILVFPEFFLLMPSQFAIFMSPETVVLTLSE